MSPLKQALIAVMISLLVVAPLIWMAMDRDPPWEFSEVEISPVDVRQGDEIAITFTTKQLRRMCGPGLVYREFRDSSGRLIVYDPVQRAEAPELDSKGKFTRSAKIPLGMDPGPAVYRGTSCYTCNPLQNWLRWPICVSTPDVHFNVLKKVGE